MVRLSSTLLAFAAAALLGCGSAFSTTLESDEVKTSHVAPQTLVQPIDPLSNADGNVKRFLRNVDTREETSDESEEERSPTSASVKALLPGSAKRLAAKEDAIIKKNLDFFNDLVVRRMGSSHVSNFFRSSGYSKKKAQKMELLFEKYKANPSAYHD